MLGRIRVFLGLCQQVAFVQCLLLRLVVGLLLYAGAGLWEVGAVGCRSSVGG